MSNDHAVSNPAEILNVLPFADKCSNGLIHIKVVLNNTTQLLHPHIL